MARTKDPALERRRRDLIRTTTYRLLAQQSFQAVTLAQVASAAGVSKGLVTYYYASKDALFRDTIGTYQARYEALFERLAACQGSDDERLKWVVHAALSSQRAVADEVRVQVEVWSFAKSRPDVQMWLRARYRAFRMACAELLLGADGARDMGRAQAVHALLDGLSFQIAADSDADMRAYRAVALEAIKALLSSSR